MPRKAFVADFQEAKDTFHKGNVSDLRSGQEDGMIKFEYHSSNGDTTEITVLIPDLGEYPDSHIYMIYTDSQHVPKPIHTALDKMANFSGTKVLPMLVGVTKALEKASGGTASNPVDLESQDTMEIDSEEESEPADGYDDMYSDDEWSSQKPNSHDANRNKAESLNDSAILSLNERIRNDLRLAKEAGFHVSCLGSLLDGGRGGILCLSIRVDKLRISSEALQAWHVDPRQYFVMLIRYNDGYTPLEMILERANAYGGTSVEIQVGLHKKHKTSIQEATVTFVHAGTKNRKTEAQAGLCTGLDPFFISKPLANLLNDRLLVLLKYRSVMGMAWRGAEEFYNDHQGCHIDGDGIDPKYFAKDESDNSETLSGLVVADHLSSTVEMKSFPLLAMQFALRHLVRCTEFCLNCHCKIDVDFEALKPYVCSRSLCLFQYMTLGFGPSIEHEIITQPHVVDLLVSFCFISAYTRKLRSFPAGLALKVPPVDLTNRSQLVTASKSPWGQKSPHVGFPLPCRAKFDSSTNDLLFSPGEKPSLQIGNWVVYGPASESLSERYHARVLDILLPTVRLSSPIPSPRNAGDTVRNTPGVSTAKTVRGKTGRSLTTMTPPPSSTNLVNGYQEVEFAVYSDEYDQMDDAEKQAEICLLLDTLPSVGEMRRFLLAEGPSASLKTWTNRISPAALGVLRWIIASNRSCIMQVDSLQGGSSRPEDRVKGMPGWMQFRFAQGAPDKEQRFVASVRQKRPDAEHPTLFAWHGSPLYNWHGIVREGLHFETKAHGRAFGDGVYHALDVATSLGYTNPSISRPGDQDALHAEDWPGSELKISQAVILNEIVNAPSDFVSQTPHLVVSQLDWIQSRYLFVMCNSSKFSAVESNVKERHPQDPAYTPLGQRREPIVIPSTVVSRSRRFTTAHPGKNGSKKQKIRNSDEMIEISDDSDLEDRNLFMPTDREEKIREAMEQCRQEQKLKESPQTDFIPGTHNAQSLPLTHPPSYATSAATRTLQRELNATLKIQDRTPMHELGWYIDRELISNVYQWILELHSFEAQLPLAKDLKAKGMKSVVLEMRFGKDYPMTPPFVRVIRPRFLSFMQGGGGHVTAGGALCMELLTNSGWSAVSNIESVLLQVRLAMSSTDPKPARLAPGGPSDYSVGEAVEAYIRACTAHGWQIPPDFQSSHNPALSSS